MIVGLVFRYNKNQIVTVVVRHERIQLAAIRKLEGDIYLPATTESTITSYLPRHRLVGFYQLGNGVAVADEAGISRCPIIIESSYYYPNYLGRFKFSNGFTLGAYTCFDHHKLAYCEG